MLEAETIGERGELSNKMKESMIEAWKEKIKSGATDTVACTWIGVHYKGMQRLNRTLWPRC